MNDDPLEMLSDEEIDASGNKAVSKLPCVYVLQTPLGYKIGHTTNLELRLRELQTGSPAPLITEALIPTHAPVQLEGCLHRRFAAKRTCGEWFALSADDVAFLRRLDAQQIRELLRDDDIPF